MVPMEVVGGARLAGDGGQASRVPDRTPPASPTRLRCSTPSAARASSSCSASTPTTKGRSCGWPGPGTTPSRRSAGYRCSRLRASSPTVAETVARFHDPRIAHTRAHRRPRRARPRPASRCCAGSAEPVAATRAPSTPTWSRSATSWPSCSATDDAPPVLVPDRRPRRRGAEPERLALLTLADRASAEGLGGRPSAATFAEAIRDPRVGRPAGPAAAPPAEPADIRRLAPLVGGALGVLLVLASAVSSSAIDVPTGAPAPAPRGTAPIGPRDQSEPLSPCPAADRRRARTAGLHGTRPRRRSGRVACPRRAAPSADVDGDGCADRTWSPAPGSPSTVARTRSAAPATSSRSPTGTATAAPRPRAHPSDER